MHESRLVCERYVCSRTQLSIHKQTLGYRVEREREREREREDSTHTSCHTLALVLEGIV